MSSAEPVKEGGSWVVRPKEDGWVFEKSFPTKWKAELAFQVWTDGGRVSDYWRAARERQVSRSAKSPQHRERSHADPIVPRRQPPAPHVQLVDASDDGLAKTLVLGAGSCLWMAMYIFGPPLLLLGLVFGLLIWIPTVGKLVAAMLGGAFVTVLAGAGTRGPHPTWTGGWRYNMWGRRRSSLRTALAFLAGAVVTWVMLFG